MAWSNDTTKFDRNLAIVIGIDVYKSKDIHHLSTAVSDAEAVAKLLEEKYPYNATDKNPQIIRLCNENATLDGIRNLLHNKLPNELKPTDQDRLIVYFAGHGLPKNSDEGPTGYLVPHDAEIDRDKSFLPMQEVYDVLVELNCHHLLVVLDCCFAGTFRWATSRKLIAQLETVHKEHYDRFIRYPAWQVITSAAYDQEALDFVKLSADRRGQVDNQPHSPFALALLEALQDGVPDAQGKQYQNADFTRDGVVTAHELIVYLNDRVSKLSKDRQVPGLYPLKQEYDKGEFVFVKPDFDPAQLQAAPTLNDDNNPYRGLKSFGERHASFFFGRQKLVEELRDRLNKPLSPLTVVLGTSGSGKSSLVKAGLIPYLRQESLRPEATQCWYILNPLRPGKSPFTELARSVLPLVHSNLIPALAQVGFLDQKFQEILDTNSKQKSKPNQEPSNNITTDLVKLAQRWQTASPEAKLLIIVDYFTQLQTIEPTEQVHLSNLYDEINKSIDSLIQFFQQDFNLLANAIVQWSLSQPNTKLLLVIDQFEELLTMTESDRGSIEQDHLPQADELQEWRRFLSLLQVILGKNQQQLRVVVTLRSDFEPRFLSSELRDYWQAARFPIRAMNSDELREAIEGPALKQALYFNPPELVSKLIDEVGQMPGALPLLSFTLSELYSSLYKRWREAQDTDRALQMKDYEALGGVAGALTRRATEEYETLDKTYQATMRRLMLRMVVIDGGGVARRRVPDAELIYSDIAETDRMMQVREQLVAARLLVKGQEADQGYVEPAHDFLVRGWDKLQGWIKEEQENIALQQRLTLAANDYAKKQGALWSTENKRLDWLDKVITDTNNNWLNKLETDFIIASRKKQTDELQDIEERRKLAVSRQLAAQAELVRNQQVKLLQRSILLAVESIQLSPSFEANCALMSGLNLWPPAISKIDGQFDAVTFSPDEQYIALTSIGVQERRQIQIYNIKQGEQVILIDEHSHVSEIPTKQAISFSPGDGRYLIAVTVSSSSNSLPSLQAWDTLTGKIIIDITSLDIKYDPYISKNSLFKKTALSSDGKLIASVLFISGKQLIKIWEIATGLETDVISPKFQIDSISFNAGMLYAATVDETSYSRFMILNAITNQELIRIVGDKETRIVNFSPDGKYLATTYSSVIQVWDTFTGKQITRLFESNQSVLAIDFSPNGQYLSVLSGVRKNFDETNNPYILQVWEIDSGIEIARLTHNNYSERSFACSYGKYLATRTIDGIQIWSIAKGDYKDVVASIPCQASSTFAFSFDGEHLAITNHSQQQINENTIKKNTGEIVIWRSAGSKIMTLSQDILGLDSKNISLSRDCEYLAVANKEKNGRVKAWRLTTQELLIDLPQEKIIKAINFCLVGGFPQIKIACTENTQEASNLWILEEPGNKELMHTSDKLSCIAFSLDGKYLAALGYDEVTKSFTKSYTIKIFNILTGQNVECIRLENFIRVDSIALDSDGSYVAITGVENIGEEQMCIWKVRGKQIMRITSQYHLGEVAISQKYLALRIQDYIHIYLWQPEDLINEACHRLNRNLTEKEWRQYFPEEPYRKICSNLP